MTSDFVFDVQEREDTPVWFYNQKFTVPFLTSLKDELGSPFFNQVCSSYLHKRRLIDSVSNAALMVAGFHPELGFFADFPTYT